MTNKQGINDELDFKESRQKKTNQTNIWIDMDNSPHIPFFDPIIRELAQRGYLITITIRDCFQVAGLADLHGLSYSRVGKHYGKNRMLKIGGTVYRSLQLSRIALKVGASMALSHGSRSQMLASKLLRIPSMMIGDYEHAKAFPLIYPDCLVVPEIIEDTMITMPVKWIRKYPGIKEDVYVPDFSPEPKILEELGINGGDLVVTIRPPATEAHYHNPEAEVLFKEAVEYLGAMDDVRMIILPRNEKKQGDFVKSQWAEWCDSRKIIIPEHVVDGLNLIWHSDLVISGGGTMNREAGALGVPVYSIFRGTIGAVDKYLAKEGRLTLIEKPEDLKTKMKVVHRDKPKEAAHRDRIALKRIVDIIEEFVQMKK